MPFLELDTSFPEKDLPEGFAESLCSAAASILDKPRERVLVVIRSGLTIVMGGSFAPFVLLNVSAIGVVGTAEQNKEHSAKLFDFLTKELSLEPDRIRIRFLPMEPWQVGVKGTVMTYL
ncbi:D-dopachrome decarboxylase-like [Pelobates fuscus]|uniref:D-dopachrome decarboxylase-like n=1 Tax=Pelobates fuscus TaxID=191477 RepID=UPI002FE4CA96